MAGKRHHFLAQLMLRRFAESSGKRDGLVWRLDKKTGQPRPVAPKYEAALPHYYRLENADGTTDSRPEDLLSFIEGKAAAVLHRIGRGEHPDSAERAWLALFAVLQHRRSPAAREWLNFLDEFVTGLTTEVSLANVEEFHRRGRHVDPGMTPEEIEEVRVELLEDLQAGRVKLGSTPSREVAIMFVAADRVAEDLVANFTWVVVRAPAGAEFVLPDMGITLYDPTPPTPASGLGFRSSPNTEAVLPVDPSFAIAFSPGPPAWKDVDVDRDAVEEINLRSYAWSNAAFYGRSQKVVTDLRALARRERTRIGQFKPRSGRIWIAEGRGGPPKAGEYEFTGYAPDGEKRERFIVKPGAFEGVEPFRG